MSDTRVAVRPYIIGQSRTGFVVPSAVLAFGTLNKLFPSNPFAYPAGRAPGFDPTHVAASRSRYSSVSVSGTVNEILTGKAGTPRNPITTIITNAGPGVILSGTNAISSTGLPTANSPEITIAGIFTLNSSLANKVLFAADSAGTGGNGFALSIGSLAPYLVIKPLFTNVQPGLTCTVGVPMFYAASCNASASAFVMLRLDNGAILTATGSGLTSTAPDGGCIIGNYDIVGGNFNPDSINHAWMFSNKFMSLSQLLQWAADPWSFWYPIKKYLPH